MYNTILMDGDFKIIRDDIYLDGGSKSYFFDDGIVIYQDFRLQSETKGAYFHGDPANGNMILLSGDRRELIKNYTGKYNGLQ